jgi:uncharacterized protein YndB with AHSA1/START domain
MTVVFRDFRETRASQEEEIVIECDLSDPPAKVWRALTVPELLAAWLSDDISSPAPREEESGSVLRNQEVPGTLDVELLDCEPQRALRYRWRTREGSAAMDSVLSFELTPIEGGGTHLRIVHGDFRAASVVFMTARSTLRLPRWRPGGPLCGGPPAGSECIGTAGSALRWAA